MLTILPLEVVSSCSTFPDSLINKTCFKRPMYRSNDIFCRLMPLSRSSPISIVILAFIHNYQIEKSVYKFYSIIFHDFIAKLSYYSSIFLLSSACVVFVDQNYLCYFQCLLLFLNALIKFVFYDIFSLFKGTDTAMNVDYIDIHIQQVFVDCFVVMNFISCIFQKNW